MTDAEKAFDLLQKMGKPEVTFQDLLNLDNFARTLYCNQSISEEEPIVKKNLVSTEQRRMWRKIGGINV